VTESNLEPTRIVASDLGKAGGVVLVQPSVRSVAVPAKSGDKYGGAVLFATSRTFRYSKVAKSTNLPLDF
jgi:hypothetical protein